MADDTDEIKRTLTARELNVTDDEAERLRRKYVRDKVDAILGESGLSRDVNLKAEKKLTGAALEKRNRELADEEARYERKRAADNVGERGRVERWGR